MPRRFIQSDGMSWTEAKTACESLGMGIALIEINFPEENDAILTELRRLGGAVGPRNCTDVWLGLTDRDFEGNFVLESSHQSSSYTNWYPSEPDDSNGEDCVILASEDGKWRDYACDRRETSLCIISAVCERFA